MNQEGPAVMTTVPACNVRRANFRDEFMFTFSRSSHDSILSMSYAPLVSPLAPKVCDEESLQLMKPIDETNGARFESKVSEATTDIPGMVLKQVLPKVKPPPGMTFIPQSQQGACEGWWRRTRWRGRSRTAH